MAASSRTRPGRPISLSGRVYSGGSSQYSSAAAFAFFSASPHSNVNLFHHRSHSPASPTSVNLIGSCTGRFLGPIFAKRDPTYPAPPRLKSCICSPTTHPGSFRCSLHKSFRPPRGGTGGVGHHLSASSSMNRLNARRSAMINSLVPVGTVERELVNRTMAALIRTSSHQQRRTAVFQPRSSRLFVMSKTIDV